MATLELDSVSRQDNGFHHALRASRGATLELPPEGLETRRALYAIHCAEERSFAPIALEVTAPLNRPSSHARPTAPTQPAPSTPSAPSAAPRLSHVALVMTSAASLGTLIGALAFLLV